MVKAAFSTSPMGTSFQLAAAQADPAEEAVLRVYEHEYTARSEDQSVLLQYFYLSCPGLNRMTLPAGKTYKVEVIDTWNMTKTTAFEKASGKIEIKLPGKSYMAILATEVK